MGIWNLNNRPQKLVRPHPSPQQHPLACGLCLAQSIYSLLTLCGLSELFANCLDVSPLTCLIAFQQALIHGLLRLGITAHICISEDIYLFLFRTWIYHPLFFVRLFVWQRKSILIMRKQMECLNFVSNRSSHQKCIRKRPFSGKKVPGYGCR